jgi:hypothetical protein
MGPVSVGLVDEIALALSGLYAPVVIPGLSVAAGTVTEYWLG